MNTLIITGGYINTGWAESFLKTIDYDYVIAADSGLSYADRIGITPDLILGDYDSVDHGLLDKYKNIHIETYPKEKDYTDTHIAIISAIKNGADKIHILGATGTRMDHTFTNVCNMKVAYDGNVECYIYDEHNKIYIAGEKQGSVELVSSRQYGRYVSIVPMSDMAKISLMGFKYSLDNYELLQGLSICQSNEIKEEKAYIKIYKGLVIVFETKD